VDTRQKWAAVWPHLENLRTSGVSLMDAGCEYGHWALEIAARRPAWLVTGVDQDPEFIAAARASAEGLGIENVSFVQANFLNHTPPRHYDIVLSIDSAHYLVEDEQGSALFTRFGSWLKPGGLLILLAPRRGEEVPQLPLLPPPFAPRPLFSREGLEALCREGALELESLVPEIGVAGTVAKQVARATETSSIAFAATYPAQIALSALDRLFRPRPHARRSAKWLLRARKPKGTEERTPRSDRSEPCESR